MRTAEPSSKGVDPARLERVTGWMDRYVAERKFAGSACVIMRDGAEIYFNSTGLRNLDEDLPFQRDTIVRLYSMTKPVTSVAIMMLAELGLFHLDAPVSEFIPAFNDMQALIPGAVRIDQTEPSRAPTLHELLTHTSGLSYPFNPGVLPTAMDDDDLMFKPDQGLLEEAVGKVAALPLAFQPGSRWEYSVSIDILGRVVEIVAGQSLAEFFQAQIFDPLGIRETGFRVPEGSGNRFASLYTPLAGDAMALNAARGGSNTLRLVDQHGKSAFEHTTLYSGGGGLVGTLDDYVRFAEMLRRKGEFRGERLLSPKTVEFMTRNHLPGDIASMGPSSFAEQPMEGTGFGLGGSVVLNPGRVRVPGSVGDFSWGGMASTFFWIDPVLDLSVVFLTQLSLSSSYPCRAELKALVHGALIE